MVAWPSALPDRPLRDGYEEGVPNNTIRSQMGVGPDKIRARGSTRPNQIVMNLLLDYGQVETLDSFIRNDLDQGTGRIDWVNPRTGTAVQFRIVPMSDDRLVRWNPAGGAYWRVQMILEVMP